MSRPTAKMEKIRDILRLHFELQFSNRKIAKALNLSHPTVAGYINRIVESKLSFDQIKELDDSQLEKLLTNESKHQIDRIPNFSYVHKELKRKHVTLMLLWVEYHEVNPESLSYSRFCELYRDWRKKINPSMRLFSKAGERMVIDFSGTTIPIWSSDLNSVAFRAELFVAALAASGKIYAEATKSQKIVDTVSCTVNTLNYYGGSPEIITPDNLRSAVTRADRYEPEINKTFLEMARHYNMAVIPTRPFKPKDKPKAEISVLICERWIIARLRNIKFISIEDLNKEIFKLLEVINDKPYKKLDGSRNSIFTDIEKQVLRPLPKEPYEVCTHKELKVSIDYHIELRMDRHYYSVHYSLCGEKVNVRITANVVEVFHLGKRVASHRRAKEPGFTTDPSHMPDAHKRYMEWTPSKIKSKAEKIGSNTAILVETIMKTKPHPEQGYRSCLGILRLSKKYGDQRLENASLKAITIGAYSYKSVESILKNVLESEELPKEHKSHPIHQNLRGESYYK